MVAVAVVTDRAWLVIPARQEVPVPVAIRVAAAITAAVAVAVVDMEVPAVAAFVEMGEMQAPIIVQEVMGGMAVLTAATCSAVLSVQIVKD